MSVDFLNELKNTFLSAIKDEILICNMFENLKCSVAIYEIDEGKNEFKLISINKYAAERDITFSGSVIGKRLNELYSGLSLIAINSAFKRAWESKQCEKLTLFLNQRECKGWRYCLILPITSGRILNIIDDIPDIAKLLSELCENEKKIRAAEEESRLSKEKLENFLVHLQSEKWQR
ncbi:MAG: hypothetical protein ACP5KG_07395 [Myxococcota bacterium]